MTQKINYDLVIEDPSEEEFYKQTHDKILFYLSQNNPTTFWQIVRHVQGSDRRVLRLLHQMVLAGEIKLNERQICLKDQATVKNLASDAQCIHCQNKLVPISGRFLRILYKMNEIYERKPSPTFLFDQRPVNAETTVRRSAYLALRKDLVNKKIAVIGDDDLTSLAIGLTYQAKEVVVFDIDKQLIDFINKIAGEEGLNVKAYEYDLTKTIPEEFSGKFDVFLTDPTPKEDAFNLFVSIGIDLLKKGGGYSGYVSFLPSHQDKDYIFQKILSDKKVIITDMIPEFTEYDFIKATYGENDLEKLKEFDSGERRISFYENLTRFETSRETIDTIPKINYRNLIGKATEKVLRDIKKDPRFIAGDKSVLNIAKSFKWRKNNNFLEYYASEIKKYGGLKEYIQAKSIEKKPLLDKIKKYSGNKKILEAGCGSAVNSIALANCGFELTCLDNDPEILKFAKNNAIKFEGHPKFIEGDILSLSDSKDCFDVAFSHGVLEHYSDNQIVNMINAQLSVAKTVIISIPSNFFKQEEAINGDERFLNKKHWENLIAKTNGNLVESFEYFYDSDNIKIKTLKLLSNLTFNKFPAKKPYIGFVIKRK
ncbi:MAG: bis-aminopropyl spermidine synthase family protein [Nanoarchaeota archaeon]|nr:bis-aminopropyl spermidine synthase family protein [Nanoarchaeota archaeon]